MKRITLANYSDTEYYQDTQEDIYGTKNRESNQTSDQERPETVEDNWAVCLIQNCGFAN